MGNKRDSGVFLKHFSRQKKKESVGAVHPDRSASCSSAAPALGEQSLACGQVWPAPLGQGQGKVFPGTECLPELLIDWYGVRGTKIATVLPLTNLLIRNHACRLAWLGPRTHTRFAMHAHVHGRMGRCTMVHVVGQHPSIHQMPFLVAFFCRSQVLNHR